MYYLTDMSDGSAYMAFRTEEEGEKWIKENCEYCEFSRGSGLSSIWGYDYHGHRVELT